MPKTKRNFGITVVNGETLVDLTEEFEQWCAVNKVKLEDFIWWMHTARNNSAVITKVSPHALRLTDSNARLVINQEVNPKTAYAIADAFITWYIKRIEDFMINMHLMTKMQKSLNIQY